MKLSLLFCLLGAASAHADVLLTDAFDYQEAAPVAGSGPWSSTSQGAALVIGKGNLRTPPGHPAAAGNRVFFPANSMHQSVARPIADIEAKEVFVSCLIRVDNIGRHAGAHPKTYGSLLRLEVKGGAAGAGLFLAAGSREGTFQLAVHKRANGGAISSEPVSPDLELGKVHHVVVSYQVQENGDDRCSLWVNPDLSGTAPSGAAATPRERMQQRAGGSTAMPAPTVTTQSGRDLPEAVWGAVVLDPPNGGSAGFYDELRVATSWEELWK